ncbi:MAG: glutamate carboxypeptidase [Thermoleophilaceae bacterium]|jgi:glutamate carboxypeptidase|nr:glutamate carboxypeptidase [Thermoleophilaceae bacterium]
MDAWVETEAARIARRAERELEALVAVSSPSGDQHGAEEAVSLCAALMPADAEVERLPCSTEGYADDLLARLRGTGEGRLLLLGHLDTVVTHDAHRPLERVGDRLVGSGAVDMKGGVVIALGLAQALAQRLDGFAEVALLMVTDEEWRVGGLQHASRFQGFDACLCFEAGQLSPEGEEGVVVKRKAASTLRVAAKGLSAHSGSAPDRGRNALLALAVAAERVAGCHDPSGPDRLSAVPTIMNSGEAFNVVPDSGELFCDLRADDAAAFDRVAQAVPAEVGGATLEPSIVRLWPGMDARQATTEALERATGVLGRPIVGVERGGASDASHLATVVPVTIDGLGPRGGRAHNPEEFVLAESLHTRAEVALALAAALLDLS